MKVRTPLWWALLLVVGWGIGGSGSPAAAPDEQPAPFVVVLGIAQDAGVPQAGTKEHRAWEHAEERRHAACLGIVDPASGERFLVEATPDFKEQLHQLDLVAPADGRPGLAGILLTHAHMGHYLGLAQLGHEAIGARAVPVWAMPRMAVFLRSNGPWDQLVRYENIVLRPLQDGVAAPLNARISATPLRVPHREEYSEVVGFRIQGPSGSVLFLPDIDKWKRWDEQGTRIEDVIASVDVAYLDATFFAAGEIPGRDMSSIPHPLVSESMDRFRALPAGERSKIRFIHLNHTNKALHGDSAERREIASRGFRLAAEGERVAL